MPARAGDVGVASGIDGEPAWLHITQGDGVEERLAVGAELHDLPLEEATNIILMPYRGVDVAGGVDTDADTMLHVRAAQVGRIRHHGIDHQGPRAVVGSDLEADPRALDAE